MADWKKVFFSQLILGRVVQRLLNVISRFSI
jgi:hypothetical protein